MENQSLKNFVKSFEFILLVVGFLFAQIEMIGIGPKMWFLITIIVYLVYNVPAAWAWIRRNLKF